jgi:SAM-dependent methyltransferase
LGNCAISADETREKLKNGEDKMVNRQRLLIAAAVIVLSSIVTFAQTAPKKDVPYVPTRQNIVEAMLSLAKVKKDDVVYDLGCGDGRIVITAAKLYGASGVGIDIDPQWIRQANENAKIENVAEKVKFIEGDLFKQDFSKATVVTLFLLPEINEKLRPILLKQLKPGTRIVSHRFPIGKWKPEQAIRVDSAMLYLWTVPGKK